MDRDLEGMMSEKYGVRLIHAALDEVEGGEIILRGRLCPESLEFLHVGEYQREILPRASIAELEKAFLQGTVPDVDLGMRGERYTQKDGVYQLHDSVFVVDGLQRISVAKRLLESEVPIQHVFHKGNLEAIIYVMYLRACERLILLNWRNVITKCMA